MNNFTEILLNAQADDLPVKECTFSGEMITGLDCEKIDFDHVSFERCRFIDCCFSHCSFVCVSMKSCDFSNCLFDNSYWRESEITACKANGAVFEQATLRKTCIKDTPLRYSNFTRSCLDHCILSQIDMRECAFSEVKLQKSSFDQIDFSHADFFKTALKGVDLSSCCIDGILLSDHLQELKGLTVGYEQAPFIASLLGVKTK